MHGNDASEYVGYTVSSSHERNHFPIRRIRVKPAIEKGDEYDERSVHKKCLNMTLMTPQQSNVPTSPTEAQRARLQ